jgi:hypothetical protein
MGNKHSHQFPEQPISLSEQVAMMKRHFPNFRMRWKKNVIIWIGELHPAPFCNHYRVRIIHQLHKSPNVHVLKPLLTDPFNEGIPHTYPGNCLCLFHPKKREWTQRMYIALSVIPWISLWLFYYEIWQATGEWMGGGEHPDLRKHKRRSIIRDWIQMEGKISKILAS